MKRDTLKYILKLVFGLLIIVVILYQIRWEDFFITVKKANYFLLVSAFSLLLIERVWAVFKWRQLLIVQGAAISMWRLFCIYTIGAFWGLFLPSSLGTDVARGYYLAKSSNAAISVASVVVDRLMGILSLFFICFASIFFSNGLLEQSITNYIYIVFAAVIVGLILLLQDRVPDVLEKKISFFSVNPIGMKLLEMHRAFLRFKKYPGTLFLAFLYSLVLQIIRVVTIYVTALAFSINIGIETFFVVVPVSIVVIMIPVSIGGLGVREGAFVFLFSLFGVSVNSSFVISSTNSIMVTIIGLLGGFIFMLYRDELGEKNISKKIKL